MRIFGSDGAHIPKEKYKYHVKEWEDRDDLFTDLHNAILELAKSNPDIEFVIKPKLEMMSKRSWNFYEDIVEKSNIDVTRLSNYKVLPEANTHKLIFESDVICALQSSTALESAIAKKRVIFPLFYQFHNSPYLNNFLWGKHIDLFDIANNEGVLLIDINKYLKDKNDTGLIWWDYIHPTDYGHQLIVESIMKSIANDDGFI